MEKYNVSFEKVKDAFGIKPNYQPPISELLGEITTEYIRNRENHFIAVVSQQVGYQVDKDKLLKTLEYDRNQYMQGFNDALCGFVNAKQEILAKIFKTLESIKYMDENTWYDVYCAIKNEIDGEENPNE